MHHVQSQSLACLSINGQVIDELVSGAKRLLNETENQWNEKKMKESIV